MDLPPYSDHQGSSTQESNGNAYKEDSKLKNTSETQLPSRATSQLPQDLDYTRDWSENIVCTDTRLDDPVLFSAFIQHHGAKPPQLTLRIRGTHQQEHKTSEQKSEHRTVTDFDFTIALTSEILIKRKENTPPYYFTYLPEIATYRGTTLRHKQKTEDEEARIEAGLSTGQQAIVQYLSSTKPLKEFRFEKVISGWDMKYLKHQIVAIIQRDAGYGIRGLFGRQDTIEVSLEEQEKFIYIRPATRFSMIYRHPLVVVLRWILFPIGLLLYFLEMVWLGAYWQVLGAKYDLFDGSQGMSVDAFLMYFHPRIASCARDRYSGTVEWY